MIYEFLQILVILESTKLDELKKEYSDAKKKQKSMETLWNWHFVHFSEIFNQEIIFLDESLKLDDGKVGLQNKNGFNEVIFRLKLSNICLGNQQQNQIDLN